MILYDKEKNNMIGHCLLATINIPIKLEYINDVNIADNHRIEITIYLTGSDTCIAYCNDLITSHNYLQHKDNKFYFKCNHVFEEDYDRIVEGNYSMISKEYKTKFNKLYNSLTPNHILMLYLPYIIVNNDEKSLKQYWNKKLDKFTPDTKNWIINLMSKNGNYYSKSNKWNVTNDNNN